MLEKNIKYWNQTLLKYFILIHLKHDGSYAALRAGVALLNLANYHDADMTNALSTASENTLCFETR